jgi:hypothetical protein
LNYRTFYRKSPSYCQINTIQAHNQSPARNQLPRGQRRPPARAPARRRRGAAESSSLLRHPRPFSFLLYRPRPSAPNDALEIHGGHALEIHGGHAHEILLAGAPAQPCSPSSPSILLPLPSSLAVRPRQRGRARRWRRARAARRTHCRSCRFPSSRCRSCYFPSPELPELPEALCHAARAAAYHPHAARVAAPEEEKINNEQST